MAKLVKTKIILLTMAVVLSAFILACGGSTKPELMEYSFLTLGYSSIEECKADEERNAAATAPYPLPWLCIELPNGNVGITLPGTMKPLTEKEANDMFGFDHPYNTSK